MEAREWALVVFTIAVQMSVGAFVVAGIVNFFATRKAGAEQADRLTDRTLWAIIPLVGLGLVASLLHLGSPLKAYRSIMNLGESPLSLEILFSLLFAVGALVFTVMQWQKIATRQARLVVWAVTALVGLALIFAMAQIYMLPTQPAWNTVATPLTFYTTSLLLGVLAVGTVLVATYALVHSKDKKCAEIQCSLMRSALKGLGLAAVVLVGVQMIAFPLYLTYLASGSDSAQAIAETLQNEYTALIVLRLALVFVGAGVFGAVIYQRATQSERSLALLAYSAFALVLIAEVIGRFLFYVSEVTFFPLG